LAAPFSAANRAAFGRHPAARRGACRDRPPATSRSSLGVKNRLPSGESFP